MASSLENRNYVATENDIAALAGGIISAQFTMESGPRRYLRCVIATTIHELDAAQRQRSGKPEKIDADEQSRQLAALEKILDRFYPIVVKAASEDLPPGKARALELNRRTNWARTAASAVRSWIRAGYSLTTIAASRATKATLAVTARARPATPGRIKQRVETASKATMARILELAGADKDAAIAEIQLLMGQLAGQLEELGVATTRDPKEALAEHKMLRVGRQTFFPTDTQIIRQMENPS